MENGTKKWNFRGNESIDSAGASSVRSIVLNVMRSLNPEDGRRVVPMGHGDPSFFPCFRTTPEAEDAVVEALRSAKYNCYSPIDGILPARRAIADHLSQDLPSKLSPDDVYLTVGCSQSIEILISVLAFPGANILLPRPGYPYYEGRAAYTGLEVRHFNLLPEKGWEVDLDEVEALADENTVAMVIINPGNPCGNVYTHQHLKKVAETASKLGITVISDEVYAHLNFGSNPFVPMGVFGSIVPALTIGSISKRWVVPGWRLGWIVKHDPNGILTKSGVIHSLIGFLNMTTNPTTLIQGAVPQIIERTKEDFFSKIVNKLRETADKCYEGLKEIPSITCPHKPEGSMFVMVKLNLSCLEGIRDDMDFCLKLAEEESVIILPGVGVGMKNWLRITYAIEPSVLDEGLVRLKAFHLRHAKKQ